MGRSLQVFPPPARLRAAPLALRLPLKEGVIEAGVRPVSLTQLRCGVRMNFIEFHRVDSCHTVVPSEFPCFYSCLPAC